MTKGVYKKLLLLFFLLPVALFAQNLKKTEKQARDLFKYGEFRDALPLYRELQQAEPENPVFLTRYAICCIHSDLRRDALPFLLRAKDKEYSEDKINFYLGKAFHLNHDFDKAIHHFELAKRKLDMVKDMEDVKHINQQIQMCKYGKELVKAPVKVDIVNLGYNVNSPHPEFVPVVSADETTLLFTSRRPNTTGGQIAEETNHYYEDIYISYKDDDNIWGEPHHMQHNSEGHDACVSISPQGEKLFIYRHENNGDIYVSTLKGNEWSVPVPMGEGINTKYREPSLSISPDEKVVFFSSDRPGGYGGLDIYYSVIGSDYKWAAPVNAGPIINTEFDEDAPFVHADGKTLYFSSKGHNSMGGYDIFTSQYHIGEKSFKAPVNIGYPINTADNDIFFVWSADGTRAYFSSVREDGFGEKDLYMLTRTTPKSSLIVFKGKVLSKPGETETAVGANVKVYDNETNQLVQEFESNSASGKFLVLLPPGKNYQISIEEAGYLPYSENLFIPDKDEFFEFQEDIVLERLQIGSMANLKNVFFDLNKATLRKESSIELDRFVRFMQENSDLYFEVAGHTDSIGSGEYNYKLSESRAQAVVNYLASKGIDKSRLFAIGYGEDYAVAPNSSKPGRQLNRRTELIIIDKPDGTAYNRKTAFYVKRNAKN